MNAAKYLVILAVGVVLGAGGFLGVQHTDAPKSGSVTSGDVLGYLNVGGVLTAGGTVFATSSAGASTISGTDLITNSVIERSGTGALTMTLTASTSVPGLFRPGQSRTIYVFNNGSGALTLAGGTGTLLESASTTAIGVNGFGRLDFVRKANTDIEVLFAQGI